MGDPLRRAARTVFIPGLALAIGLLVSGCEGSPTVEPSASAEASPSVSASESPNAPPPQDPTLLPGGTAEDNLAFFDLVNSRFLSSDPTPGGRAIIDNLVSAGFDKAAMQVTPDKTPTGLDADSVEFSVRFGDRCLIGQASQSGYVGVTGPAITGSSCLIGTTRAIDW